MHCSWDDAFAEACQRATREKRTYLICLVHPSLLWCTVAGSCGKPTVGRYQVTHSVGHLTHDWNGTHNIASRSVKSIEPTYDL